MRRRSERTLKELYDRTERILEAEGVFPTEENLIFVNDCIGMKIASGTCNICSAPCSSCMHGFRSSSVIGSTSNSGCSGNICSTGKDDICYSVTVNGTKLYKNRTCDDSQNAYSETSDMLGMSSSHNSYSENAECKSTLKAFAAHDLEDLDKPQMGFSGEVIKKEQPLEEKTYEAQFSADSHISIHSECRDPLGQGEEQLGLECHGDNISCITGGIDANISDYSENLDKKDMLCGFVLTNNLILDTIETSVLPEAGDGPQVHEIEEDDSILLRSNATADASILNDTSNSASVSTAPDNSGFPLLKLDVSPISQSLISHSKNILSSFDKADFSDTEGNLNMKLQAGCMKFAKVDNVESSLGSFSSVSSAEKKLADLQNVKVSRTNEARSCLSSEKSKVDDLCQEFGTDTNSRISSDNGSRSGDLKEALEKDNALLDLETNNREGYDLLPLANTEIENSESEIALYDVKVCDICGDVGREALLAICSRCSDGAEHTYCMREKLDKLPGVDWLCEECEIKEVENQNVDKAETISGGSNPAFSSRTSQKSVSTLIPKKSTKLDSGVNDLDVRGLAKGLESPNISTGRQADHVKDMEVSEANVAPIKTANPRTPVLSRVLSFKSQKVKEKKSNMESSEGQSVNGLQVFHHSQNSLSSGSFKGRPQAHSANGHFSRSSSFSKSIINQNVKQLVENVNYKQKIKREAMSPKLRNETLVKSINKSASFKSSGSGISNSETAPSRIENPRGLFEVKERITVEKQNPSAVYKTCISKLAAPARISHLKRSRSSLKERNVKSAIESSDLGCNGSRKRILHSSKSMEFLDEKFNSENRNKTLHLQNCNQTGHATQQCSTDELQGLAYRPSNERSLSEMMKMVNKCEDVVDAMVPRTRMVNKSKNLDKDDKVQVASAEVICKADPRETSSSFSQKNIALAADSGNDKDSLQNFSVELGKAVAAIDTVNHAVHPTESLLVPKANRLSHIPTVNELNVKSRSETSPGEASVSASPLRASTIPKLKFIWRGSFNVLRSDGCLQCFDGMQAHLSTCASHGVLEVATVVPSKIQLEEVSQTNLWPRHCEGIGPNEENIALFFFAKDNESYETSYSTLLNKMLKNDLALRGEVDEAELFIFTSKMLPVYSQRWNTLYYFWGMFIGKRNRCSSTQKKNCESTLGIEFLVQDTSEQPLRNGPNAQNLDTTVASKLLSECEKSAKIKQGNSTMFMDSHCIPSDVEDKACRTETVTDAKIIKEISLFPMNNSFRTTVKPLDVIGNSELQLQTSQLSYKVKIGMSCQDKFLSNGTNKKIGDSPHAFEASLGRASPVPSVSLNDSDPVEECSNHERKMRKRHCSPADLAILGYNPRKNISELSCSTETRWMQVDDEREQKKSSSFGEENLSSTIFSQQQHAHSIFSGPVMPEISRTVERCFFPVDIIPSTVSKIGTPAHIPSSNDDDDQNSHTPDLELTVGIKNKKTKPAPPLLSLLLPSADIRSHHRRSGPSGNHGDVDDLSALLSL